jgi:subtilisin family serine protease
MWSVFAPRPWILRWSFEEVADEPDFRIPSDRPVYVPGEVIVRVHPDVLFPLSELKSRPPGEVVDALPEPVAALIARLRPAGLHSLEPLFASYPPDTGRSRFAPRERYALALAHSVADLGEGPLGGVVLAKVRERSITDAFLQSIASERVVDYAERSARVWPAASAPDPVRNLQWGLRAIGWFHASLPSARAIQVAVIDTGVDTEHPDLEGVVARYEHKHLTAKDPVGHGTHVAGILAAKTNDEAGIAGVADCQLAVWKVFPDRPQGGDFYAGTRLYHQALREVRDSDARVLNLSIGKGIPRRVERAVIEELIKKGTTVVAAMGNEHDEGSPTVWPAAYPGVISVGAVNEGRTRAHFSNTGAHIDLLAPGSNILSTLPVRASRIAGRSERGFAAWSGTSMAAPHVSAAAALLCARNRRWGPEEIRAHLRDTAMRPFTMKRDWTSAFGAGVLDLVEAFS